MTWYEPELTYDLTLLGVSLDIVLAHPSGWHTVALIISMLLRDPTSWLFAACNKWEYPLSREDATLREIFDLVALIHSKRKPRPYPRPFSITDNEKQRIGSTTLPAAQAMKILDHFSPVPNQKGN